MKTNRFYVIALSLLAVVSCDILGDNESPSNNGTIGFSRLSFSSIKTKSPSQSFSSEYSFSDDLSEASFHVIRSEEYIHDDVETRGTAMDASHLLNFHVDGFLDEEIMQIPAASSQDKSNLHFINKEPVTKNGDKWAFVNDQNWRFGTHHYFWGFYPEVNLSFAGNDFTKASFDYVSSPDEDLILSYTPRYYGKEDEDESLRKSSLSLEFNHALSAVRANTDAVVFKIKDKNGVAQDPKTDEEKARGQIVDVSFRGKSSGTCEVTGNGSNTNLDFAWTTSSSSTVQGVNDNNDHFMIPQNSKDVLTVFTVRDNLREVTRQYPYPNLLGDGKTSSGVESFMWDPGKRYFYDIAGKFVLPYQANTSVTGMDFGFAGNKLRDRLVIDNLDPRYVKSLEVSWTGVPTSGTKSNGTFGFISIEPRNADGTPRVPDFITSSVDKAHEFIVGDYYLPGNLPNTTNPNIGFIYNLAYGRNIVESNSFTKDEYNQAVPKGTCDFNSSNPEEITCRCVIAVPQDWTNGFDIFAFYYGGDNSACTWKVHDFSVIIHEWRID